MKEFWVYTGARLGIFAVTLVALMGLAYLIGGVDALTSLWPLIGAAIVSSAISAVVLRQQRAQFVASVTARADRMAQRTAERDAQLDAAFDAQLRAEDPGRSQPPGQRPT